MATKISTNNAPAAIGPYSQAIVAGDFLFASGQIPINPATGNVEATDITGQAEQSMKNVGAILEAAGASYDKVVKTTCFLADIADFAAFRSICKVFYTESGKKLCRSKRPS